MYRFFYQGMALRWAGWTSLWVMTHPELHSVAGWVNEPSLVMGSVAQYWLSGMLLEVTYRKLAWGHVLVRKPYKTAIRPECPEHPWISLFDKVPEFNSKIEVFCADGVTRKAVSDRHAQGDWFLRVEFEHGEDKLKRNPWRLRPTHWRKCR